MLQIGKRASGVNYFTSDQGMMGVKTERLWHPNGADPDVWQCAYMPSRECSAGMGEGPSLHHARWHKRHCSRYLENLFIPYNVIT